MTPFLPWQAALVALTINVMGFFGGFVLSAIKRDRGVKDWGSLIEGHGGMPDQVDSISFGAGVLPHHPLLVGALGPPPELAIPAFDSMVNPPGEPPAGPPRHRKTTGSAMNPIQLFDPASSTYTYVLFDEASREALIIDPVDEQIERDLAILRGTPPQAGGLSKPMPTPTISPAPDCSPNTPGR